MERGIGVLVHTVLSINSKGGTPQQAGTVGTR